jgi:hypothetical protein
LTTYGRQAAVNDGGSGAEGSANMNNNSSHYALAMLSFSFLLFPSFGVHDIVGIK